MPVAILDSMRRVNMSVKQKTSRAAMFRAKHTMRMYFGLNVARMPVARADPIVYPK